MAAVFARSTIGLRSSPGLPQGAGSDGRYEVLVDSDQDESMARQLLSPSLVVWLAEHPLAPCFEIRAGMLVVFVSHVLEDEGSLTYLMDAARRIASRVAAETAEARTVPAAILRSS